MKNYLTSSLSNEEKKEIMGIIWMVVKNFKYNLYKQTQISHISLENLELSYNDNYSFFNIEIYSYPSTIAPLSTNEKTHIVNSLNLLLEDLNISPLLLTFNEKLVFFFVFMEDFKAKDTQILLSVSKKTIYNWQQSIKTKLQKIKEDFENEATI